MISGWLCISLVSTGLADDREVAKLRREVDQLKAVIESQRRELEELRNRLSTSQHPISADKGTSRQNSLTFYGFLRADAIWDTGQTNNAQTPFFIHSPARPGTNRTGNRQFTVHPRLTRLGFNWASGQSLFGLLKPTAKFEIDWQNAQRLTPESRPIPRIRHAYFELLGRDWNLLVGQTWDLISPLFPSPNDDTLMWNAGNLGDRRPQIRFTYAPSGEPWQWALALGLTGAVDAKDLDGNGVFDGEDSGLPTLQTRFAYRIDEGTLGIWSHIAWEQTTTPVGGSTRFVGYSLGLDWSWDLGKGWSLRGEGWIGRNLSDVRGGIGQGVLNGREVQSRGGWLELGKQIAPDMRVSVGFTFDDPKDRDVPPTPVPPAANAFAFGRILNSAYYIHYRLRLKPALELGANYLYWRTRWRGQPSGTDHRFNFFVQQNF